MASKYGGVSMSQTLGSDKKDEINDLQPLDPLNPPPPNRFCDLIMDGGVINGIVYPGFLIELARRFRFHGIGGTSVGAIAAGLAAASEYSRRYGNIGGYNEGLAQMPQELAAIVSSKESLTRIRSLFQPDPKIKPLFDWFVDLVEQRFNLGNQQLEVDTNKVEAERTKKKPTEDEPIPEKKGTRYFDSFRLAANAYWLWLKKSPLICKPLGLKSLIATGITLLLLGLALNRIGLNYFWSAYVVYNVFLFTFLPLFTFLRQLQLLIETPGVGFCTGLKQKDSPLPGLFEWLHESIQKSAGSQFSRPLTFQDLWSAPGAPIADHGVREERSIDFRVITACLSHGRVYELPLAEDDPVLMFRFSDFEKYFPEDVIKHLHAVSEKAEANNFRHLNRKFNDRFYLKNYGKIATLEELEIEKISFVNQCFSNLAKKLEDAGNDFYFLPMSELPIVVAIRMSMSCPVLFQSIPMWSLNFDQDAENFEVVKLWFTDGGVGSNFPIHLFDQALPKWPTFGLKILEDPPKKNSKGQPLDTYVPYWHHQGADDSLLFPNDKSSFTIGSASFGIPELLQFLFSIYATAKDGNDQSFIRMPDVRNRVVRIFLNGRTGNMLNLKISAERIRKLAMSLGAKAGQSIGDAYLAEIKVAKYSQVDLWSDHRYVRLNMLLKGLKQYLAGFGYAAKSKTFPRKNITEDLLAQVQNSVSRPALNSVANDEPCLTSQQALQLTEAIEAIVQLEKTLNVLAVEDLPYTAIPMPDLRFKPSA